jgi:glutamyl-tRNA synthetase
MSDRPVITRFAPSPTGSLHIGGARTALFNYLFARHHGGKFLLRVEDTDKARSTEKAVDVILEGLNWLGLNWDGEPVFQSAREAQHRAAVETLLHKGCAYRCYATAEELEAMREAARAKGQPMRYDGRWRERDPSQAPPGAPYVIRFRAPQNGATTIDDVVQGRVSVDNAELDDLILARSDGTPTYNLAVVVDDHDMQITHVIRGDDHFTNAFRQAQIIEALGWPRPVYAHIPLIHGEDGAKLSKRHGATAIGDYRRLGYLPEALRNYLARLGWSHGDDEIFATEQAIAWFSLEAIGRAPARLDRAKLDHVNHHYLRLAVPERILAETEWLLGRRLEQAERIKLLRAIPVLTERVSTMTALVTEADFLLATRPLVLTAKARQLLTHEMRATLKLLASELALLEPWSKSKVEEAVRQFCDQHGIKFGTIAQSLRAALSGGHLSPGIFDMADSLGREETLARIADQAVQCVDSSHESQ